MPYVDGFLVPILRKNIKAYRKLAAKCGKIWREYGALDYKECIGDDLRVQPQCGKPFPKQLKLRQGETVMFSYIVYKSRAQRDRINAKIQKDPRILAMCGKDKIMPFDVKRMCYGGFRVLVDAS